MAKDKKWENVFIFEDDVKFHNNFNEMFEGNVDDLPEDWDMLYLGANHWGGISEITKSIFRLHGAFCTHAYGVNEKAYDTILDITTYREKPIDVYYCDLFKDLNCYLMKEKGKKSLAIQRESHSDIQGCVLFYGEL